MQLQLRQQPDDGEKRSKNRWNWGDQTAAGQGTDTQTGTQSKIALRVDMKLAGEVQIQGSAV